MTGAKMIIGLALCVLPIGIAVAREPGSPSTPAERERAVKVAHDLEEDPLSESAAANRAWVVSWIHEVPDFRVKVCLDLIEPLLLSFGKSKDPLHAALGMQLMISGTAFMFEHPERASDDVAVSLAGLTGVLRAYERVVVVQPTSRNEFLDKLIKTKDEGELPAYVTAGVSKCGASK